MGGGRRFLLAPCARGPIPAGLVVGSGEASKSNCPPWVGAKIAGGTERGCSALRLLTGWGARFGRFGVFAEAEGTGLWSWRGRRRGKLGGSLGVSIPSQPDRSPSQSQLRQSQPPDLSLSSQIYQIRHRWRLPRPIPAHDAIPAPEIPRLTTSRRPPRPLHPRRC